MPEPEEFSERDDDREHHPDSGEDRAGDEVRRENGGVPSRHERHGEVEGHDRVDRQHERSRERCEEEIRAREVSPLAIRVAPTEGKNAENALSDRADSLAIAED